MKLSFYSTIYMLIGFFALQSCANDISKNLSPDPIAFGNTNYIVVICENDMWEGAIGDTIRNYFGAAYPILPQPEPMFDLVHYNMKDLAEGPARKELRNYIVLGQANDADSHVMRFIEDDLGSDKVFNNIKAKKGGSSLGKDKWAQGQQLMYVYGQTEEDLTAQILKHYPTIAKRVHNIDLPQIEGMLYGGGQNGAIQKRLKEDFGLYLKVPHDFYVALHDSAHNTIWLRHELKDFSGNLLIKKMTYENESQFSEANLKSLRDQTGKKYITTAIQGAYMQTNDKDLPLLYQKVKLKDYYAVELRGIWDMANDFMGGPFITYLINKPNTKELIFIDVFIHAPGKDKRDYLQRLEHVISSLTL